MDPKLWGGRVLFCGSHPAAELGGLLVIWMGWRLPHGGQPVSVAVGRYVWPTIAGLGCPAAIALGWGLEQGARGTCSDG